MYNFRDILPTDEVNEKNISSEALLINDKTIESQIPQYQTLTVTGRGPLAYEINSESLDGMDGKRYVDSSFPERNIAVAYLLTTSSATEMIEAQDKLAAILMDKQFRFSFMDQKDWYFTGTVSDVSDPEEGKLQAKGSFTITASDPRKYSTEQSITSTDGTYQFTDDLAKKITSIDYTATADVTRLVLSNDSGQHLEIDGTVKSGDTIHLEPSTQSITLNGVTKASWLAFDSDFENYLASGSGTVDPVGKLIIRYKNIR